MNNALIIVIICGAIFLFLFIFLLISGTSEKGLEKSLTKMGNALARAQANIVKNNEDIMTETANRTANINKDSVRTITHSIKEGFSDEKTSYCKYCGNLIDDDSKFCKHCGKEQ